MIKVGEPEIKPPAPDQPERVIDLGEAAQKVEQVITEAKVEGTGSLYKQFSLIVSLFIFQIISQLTASHLGIFY